MRIFLKNSLYLVLCKIFTTIASPPYSREAWFEHTWIYTSWGCFHTSFIFFWLIKFEEKIFKDFYSIYILTKTWPPPPLLPHPTPRDHDLNKLNFTLSEDASTNFQLFCPYGFFRRKTIKIFSMYCYVKLYIPSYSRGSWFEQTLISTTSVWECFHTKLSFSGQMVFWEEDFKRLSLYTVHVFLCK